VDLRFEKFEACDRELQGMLQLLLERRVVADRGAALDAPRGGDRLRGGEQRLRQRGLAAAGLADQRKSPDPLDGM
jgi:hypothetical protein